MTDLLQARSALLWYADRLCRENPARYEVTQTADGRETKLSEAVRVILAYVAALEAESAALQELSEDYTTQIKTWREKASAMATAKETTR